MGWGRKSICHPSEFGERDRVTLGSAGGCNNAANEAGPCAEADGGQRVEDCTRSMPGAQQPRCGLQGSAQNPVLRQGHTWLPGKGMRDELGWEKKGSCPLQETHESSDHLC